MVVNIRQDAVNAIIYNALRGQRYLMVTGFVWLVHKIANTMLALRVMSFLLRIEKEKFRQNL
jgi:hypothetical protein